MQGTNIKTISIWYTSIYVTIVNQLPHWLNMLWGHCYCMELTKGNCTSLPSRITYLELHPLMVQASTLSVCSDQGNRLSSRCSLMEDELKIIRLLWYTLYCVMFPGMGGHYKSWAMQSVVLFLICEQKVWHNDTSKFFILLRINIYFTTDSPTHLHLFYWFFLNHTLTIWVLGYTPLYQQLWRTGGCYNRLLHPLRSTFRCGGFTAGTYNTPPSCACLPTEHHTIIIMIIIIYIFI